MNKLLIICGPTATGKTSLGIKLAKRFNGEIVSADSRQVYRGMDIGTGKDIPKSSKFKVSAKGEARRRRQGSKLQFKIQNFQIGYYLVQKVPIWLLDIVTPDYQFNVADYVRCANAVINDIWARGRLPILVGGTGFYIKGLVGGIESLGVEPDWELRKKISNYQIIKLSNCLKKVNPKRWEEMNESDRQNPRRLVRAIEITLQIRNHEAEQSSLHGPEPSRLAGLVQGSKLKTKNILLIGLTAPNKVLYGRIDQRVEERVKQGIVKEVKKLLKKGYHWENSALSRTIGYQEWKPYFENSQLEKAIIQKWKYDEHHYARRQMTWFRKFLRENQGIWFDISQKGWENKQSLMLRNKQSLMLRNEVERLTGKWYNENNDAEN